MKFSQVVFNVDEKPLKKAEERLSRMVKKIKEYNTLVVQANNLIDEYLKKRRKADIGKKKLTKKDIEKIGKVKKNGKKKKKS